MAKINIFKRKDNGEYKYSINLPKSTMESLGVDKGDELLFVGEMGAEIRFKLRRKSEIDAMKLKKLEEEYNEKKMRLNEK